jgi:rod shape-determining protein MreC
VPSKRFDQAHPFVALGLIVAGWLIVPTVIKIFSRATFFELTAPVSVAASYAADLREYWALRLHSNSELIQAGRDLARLNASYHIAVQQNNDLHAEVTRLENVLRLPTLPGYRYEPARVARRDFSGWWEQLIIRKGQNFGIAVGAPVVFSGGVVGRISEVHAYTAVVELISSPGVRLAASIEGDVRPISFQGVPDQTFGPAGGVIEFVPLDVDASKLHPKRLVTSPFGGVFPPGLFIGSVVKVETSTDGLFKTGEVQLDERLSSLTEVAVLIPQNPE